MSHQFHAKRILMLTADANPDYPKGTFLCEGVDGHWYAYKGHKNSPREVTADPVHDIDPPNPDEWPLRLFRDYWQWVSDSNKNVGAPFYDAIFNAPFVLVRQRKQS